MRIAIYTLGCKLNQCESEGLADAFDRQGFSVVKPSEEAEMYLVNTCTVTSKAEQKARRMIRKFAHMAERPIVLVTGCYAQMNEEDIRLLDDRLLVVPLDKKASLLMLPGMMSTLLKSGMSAYDAVRAFLDGDHTESTPFDYQSVTFVYHARAFLKIEDGCDNSCAYCRVTLARGPAMSLSAGEVVSRCLEIEQGGYREIVFTGVNITAYSSEGHDLAGLLELVLSRLSERTSIRLSSLEPDMITDRLIEICRDPRVRPHFHIPIQTASERLLHHVNRDYSMETAERQIRKLVSVKESPFLAADIMTGMPSESDEDHQCTLDFLKDLGFSQVHVFPFSPRPGTILYHDREKVPEYRRDERASEIRQLSGELYQGYIKACHQKEVSGIIEQCSQGRCTAVTENYLKVRLEGVPEADQRLRGRACRLKLDTSGEEPSGSFLRFC